MSRTVDTGLRDICDMGLVDCAEEDRPLEPGDILLAKTTGNRLSTLIARLDGWWSHSALALSANQIIHSNANGLTVESLEDLRHHYKQGLAVVRPDVESAQRATAAKWAADKAKKDSKYGANEIGLAFCVLWRASRQSTSGELAELLRKEELAAGALSVDTEEEKYQATCSALVYQSYLYGAEFRLPAKTAPGIRLRDDMLLVPDDDELLEELRSQPSGKDSKRLAKIGVGGLHSAMRAWRSDEPVPVEVGVTPGDLWMSSPDRGRWFIQGRSEAVIAVDTCSNH